MERNNNIVSKIIFYIGCAEIGFGIIWGTVLGAEMPSFAWSAALYVWMISIITGALIIGFSEVIRLLQDLRDNSNKQLKLMRASMSTSGLPNEGTEQIYESSSMQAQKLKKLDVSYPIGNDSIDIKKYNHLVKLCKNIDFFLTAQDKVKSTEMIGEIRSLYADLAHEAHEQQFGAELKQAWDILVYHYEQIEERYSSLLN